MSMRAPDESSFPPRPCCQHRYPEVDNGIRTGYVHRVRANPDGAKEAKWQS